MGKFVAVHSYKGGTGKTLIATNLALILAKQGQKVCLLDLDVRAPGLRVVFGKANPNFWLNDFLDGKCGIEEVLFDLSKICNIAEGRFFVGLVDPSTEAIQRALVKDRAREMKDLKTTLSLREKFNELQFDYTILDTSPGFQYSSLNAIIASDVALIVSINDDADMDGTRRMITDLYEAFEKKTVIVLNRILCEEEYQKEGKSLLNKFQKMFNVPIIATIPLYCDILKTSRASLIALERPEHPFIKLLTDIAGKL